MAFIQVYGLPLEIEFREALDPFFEEWHLVIFVLCFSAFYIITALIPCKCPARLIIIVGLLVYAGACWCTVIASYWISNMLSLLFFAIALALITVSFMLETINTGVNPSGSAFLITCSIGLNFIVWEVMKEIIPLISSDIYMLALTKCLIAAIFAIVYFLLSGGVIKVTYNQSGYNKIEE